jgi:hypothetical protein
MKKLLLLLALLISFIVTLIVIFPIDKMFLTMPVLYLVAFLIVALGSYLSIYSKYNKTGILMTVIGFVPSLVAIYVTLALLTASPEVLV